MEVLGRGMAVSVVLCSVVGFGIVVKVVAVGVSIVVLAWWPGLVVGSGLAIGPRISKAFFLPKVDRHKKHNHGLFSYACSARTLASLMWFTFPRGL